MQQRTEQSYGRTGECHIRRSLRMPRNGTMEVFRTRPSLHRPGLNPNRWGAFYLT